MAAKTENAPAPAAAPADASAGKSGGGNALVPVLLAVIVAPVATWAVAQFVLLPQLRKDFAAPPAPAGEHGEATPAEAASGHGAEPAKGGHGAKGEKGGGAGNTYEFDNVVVNLAGTMGTRYLKVTFMVTGADQQLRSAFEGNKPKLVDVTLGVLSSLSLADLEEAGAKNIIREKLVQSYNKALGRKVAEQVYFSDFVVQ